MIDVYLDNAATTQPKSEVVFAMLPYLTDKWYNPSSLYNNAKQVREEIEKARTTIANFIDAESDEIYFTSSGSESNCWAIQGFVNQCKQDNIKSIIITSVIEHHSILACLKNVDAVVEYVQVDYEGFIYLDELEEKLALHQSPDERILVSIQYANNEIGTIQHINRITDIAHEYGAIVHTDAVQVFGQKCISVKLSNIDMLSASGHKIGCPKGIAILYKKRDVNIKPLIYGTQENGMRGGTENVPYIIAMAKAIDMIDTSFLRLAANKHIRFYLMERLESEFGCTFNGNLRYNRLSNNVSATFPQNITSEALIYMLDTCGIYVSSGSACNSSSIESSHVLKAIGLTDEEANKTVRFTLPEIKDVDEWIRKVDYVVSEISKQIKLIEE